MKSIKVTMILTGSEAGRRCVSSEAEIGVVGVRRVSGTRGGKQPGLTTFRRRVWVPITLLAGRFTVSTRGSQMCQLIGISDLY